MIDPTAALWLSALVFGLGALGVFARRSLLLMLMSFQLMTGASLLALAAFDALRGAVAGQGFGVLILTLESAQMIVALGLLVSRERNLRRACREVEGQIPW